MSKRSLACAIFGSALLVFLMLACCCPIVPPSKLPKSSSTAGTSGGQNKTNTEQAKSVNVNEDIQVGEVRWKALEVSKSESLSKGFGEATAASGVFVIIKLECELLGKESGNVDSSQFVIVDSRERVFEASTDATTALIFSSKEPFVFKQVNPNVPITGYVAFDVAKDATGLKLKIKDLRLTSDEIGFISLGI